jgi:hypothetical protein
MNGSSTLAGALLAMLFAYPGVSFAGYDHIYTDVAKCRALDTGPDESVRLCKGPGGLAAVLHYVDGKAILVFGEASGSRADEVSGTPFNANDIPISVGGSGKVFGPKIEWILNAGKPCAVIVRVSTDKGSRLVTTAIVNGKGRVSVEKSNDAARTNAEKACAGTTPSTNDADISQPTAEPELAPSSAPKVEAGGGTFLFNVLKEKPVHKATLAALFSKQKDLPDWMKEIPNGGNLVAGPSIIVSVEGQKFEVFQACETHNCADSFVRILFTMDGSSAWAKLYNEGKITYAGNPTMGQRQAMEIDAE